MSYDNSHRIEQLHRKLTHLDQEWLIKRDEFRISSGEHGGSYLPGEYSRLASIGSMIFGTAFVAFIQYRNDGFEAIASGRWTEDYSVLFGAFFLLVLFGVTYFNLRKISGYEAAFGAYKARRQKLTKELRELEG